MSERPFDTDAARHAFETALREQKPAFETFFLSRLFGLEFSYTAHTCVIRFPVHDFMYNPQGSLHGGVSAFVLDVAMGHLIKHTLGTPATTMELKTQYFVPLHAPDARCEARFLHRGRSVCFMEARLFNASGALAAAATATWRVLKPKEAS